MWQLHRPGGKQDTFKRSPWSYGINCTECQPFLQPLVSVTEGVQIGVLVDASHSLWGFGIMWPFFKAEVLICHHAFRVLWPMYLWITVLMVESTGICIRHLQKGDLKASQSLLRLSHPSRAENGCYRPLKGTLLTQAVWQSGPPRPQPLPDSLLDIWTPSPSSQIFIVSCQAFSLPWHCFGTYPNHPGTVHTILNIQPSCLLC